MNPNPLTIFVDASVCTTVAGIGAVYHYDSKIPILTKGWRLMGVTVNAAEMIAVVLALNHVEPHSLVFVYSDSQAAVAACNSLYPHPEIETAMKRHGNVTVKWLPREKNKEADRLANATRLS